MSLFAKFDQIALRKKFFCLALLCIAMAALPTWLYVDEVQKSVKFSLTEMDGLKPIEIMLNIIHRTQFHRGITAFTYLEKDHFATQRD